MAERPVNIFTVDVEDWFNILEVEGGHTQDDWERLESRVEANTDRMLALLEETGTAATFFVVGWLAERHPEMVRRIAASGHELGSHSFSHEVIQRHDRDSLGADLERSRKLLEDLSGSAVHGFRAPGNSITPETAWAFDVMLEQGFTFDASLSPGLSSHGGFPSPYHAPHRVRCSAGELVEIPVSTFRVGSSRVPYAGGGYLRLFPYRLIRSAIAAENRQGWPANIYIHPRELDPAQPRMDLPPMRHFKYYVGLRGMEKKLRRLLRDHHFVSAGQWIEAQRARLQDRVLEL